MQGANPSTPSEKVMELPLLKSKNVTLAPADVSAVERVRTRYGEPRNLCMRIQQLTRTLRQQRDALEVVLELRDAITDTKEVTALGHPLTTEFVSAGLTDILLDTLKVVSMLDLNQNNDINNNSTEASDETSMEWPLEELVLAEISQVLANCNCNNARNAGDVLFTIEERAAPTATHDDGPLVCACNICATRERASVRLGFSDYAASETGARLWAGAVALSLYVVEHIHTILSPANDSISTRASECAIRSDTVNVIEIGCGPALVSAVLSRYIASHATNDEKSVSSRLPPADLYVTDVKPSVVREAQRTLEERNTFAARTHGDATCAAQLSPLHLRYGEVDLFAVESKDFGSYDVVLGSDIVYDFSLAQAVSSAISVLLKPGGVAYICCERHRDGVTALISSVRSDASLVLDVVLELHDIRDALHELEMISALETTTCVLLVLKKKPGTILRVPES